MLKILGLKQHAGLPHITFCCCMNTSCTEMLDIPDETAAVIDGAQNVQTVGDSGQIVVISVTRSGMNTPGAGLERHVAAQHQL